MMSRCVLAPNKICLRKGDALLQALRLIQARNSFNALESVGGNPGRLLMLTYWWVNQGTFKVTVSEPREFVFTVLIVVSSTRRFCKSPKRVIEASIKLAPFTLEVLLAHTFRSKKRWTGAGDIMPCLFQCFASIGSETKGLTPARPILMWSESVLSKTVSMISQSKKGLFVDTTKGGSVWHEHDPTAQLRSVPYKGGKHDSPSGGLWKAQDRFRRSGLLHKGLIHSPQFRSFLNEFQIPGFHRPFPSSSLFYMLRHNIFMTLMILNYSNDLNFTIGFNCQNLGISGQPMPPHPPRNNKALLRDDKPRYPPNRKGKSSTQKCWEKGDMLPSLKINMKKQFPGGLVQVIFFLFSLFFLFMGDL